MTALWKVLDGCFGLGVEARWEKGVLFFPIPGGANMPKSFGVKVGPVSMTAQIKRAFRLRLDLNQQGALFPQRENPSVPRGHKREFTRGRCSEK